MEVWKVKEPWRRGSRCVEERQERLCQVLTEGGDGGMKKLMNEAVREGVWERAVFSVDEKRGKIREAELCVCSSPQFMAACFS